MRWFRFYDDAINDPKILKLPIDSRWHWAALLCIASKNDGRLPATDDIALMLRVSNAKAAAIIAELVAAGLIDRDSNGFAPHNWDGRQYKSDSSAERVKRHRDKRRNVTGNVTVTVQNRTEADTETEQKSEANASGADAPLDARTRLFREGLSDLAEITGKGPDACRSFVGKCLQAAGDDALVVLGLIEDAKRNRVANASAWIAARLKPSGHPSGKPLTEFQQKQQETNDVRAQLRAFANGGGSGREADRVLSYDPGERPEDLRGGPRATVLALPGASGRGGS